jgi:TalC/MipB family fructose-6-phosphate aldolase
MKFFADTAEVKDIQELNDLGLLDGVTTNPSLIAKSGRKFKDVIAEICAIVEGPVSAEVVSLDYEGMMREAADLRKIARNVTIKVPLTLDGQRPPVRLNPPRLGEHTETLLAELGYAPAEIAGFTAALPGRS